MRKLIKLIWPLPSPEKRKLLPFFFVPERLRRGIRIERTGDYICYQVGALTQIVGFVFLIILLIDVCGRFGLFIDTNTLATEKAIFPATWLAVVGKVGILLCVSYYLRLRLTTDLKNDQIPFLSTKDSYRGKSRREWVELSAFLSLASLIVLSESQAMAGGVIEMWHLENNLIAVVIEQAAIIYIIPFFVMFGISSTLIFEKAIRFFPQVQEDLENW